VAAAVGEHSAGEQLGAAGSEGADARHLGPIASHDLVQPAANLDLDASRESLMASHAEGRHSRFWSAIRQM
jgi:hypothetical protein